MALYRVCMTSAAWKNIKQLFNAAWLVEGVVACSEDHLLVHYIFLALSGEVVLRRHFSSHRSSHHERCGLWSVDCDAIMLDD